MNATTKVDVKKAKRTKAPKDVKIDDGLPRDGRSFDGLFMVDELTRPNVLDFRLCKDPRLKSVLQHAIGRIKGGHTVTYMNHTYALNLIVEAWPQVVDVCDDNGLDPNAWGALNTMIEGLRAEQKRMMADKVAAGKLEFADLPIYFEPGMEVFFDLDGEPAGGKVTGVSITVTWRGPVAEFKIGMIHNINGEVREDNVEIDVPGFAGLCDIDKLGVRPITEVEKKLLDERGAKFERFGAGSSYLRYSGSLSRNSWVGARLYRADGRVMIDATTFQQIDGNQHRQEAHASGFQVQREKTKVEFNLDPAERWRTVPFMYGFSFAAKTWGRLRVDGLSEIEWRGDAFDKLVLPDKQKGLVKALVEHSSGSFTDIIDGKGGGCIFLLHGPPGQGKTLTAETVAEALKRPLYSVSVGELGTDPDVLENRLRQILDVATTWNAVLLLDEADIFLEARDEHDIVRNAMVGVFLRLLEYHQGVLFLTTNRVKNIDQAFYSRVSVAIEYPEGTSDKRLLIWKGLLASAGVKGLDEVALSAHDLNGRQIKNVIRLSQTLARSEGREVDEATIREVVDLTTAFNRSHEK